MLVDGQFERRSDTQDRPSPSHASRRGRGRRADLGAVDDDHQDGRRRRNARADLRAACRRRGHRAMHVQRDRSGRGTGAHRAPLAGADRRRHPPPVQDGARRARRGRALPAAEPGQHPPARAHQARRAGMQGPGRADPHRRQRRLARSRALQEARRTGHARGHGRVRADRARLLRRGRLRRREDLGQGFVGAADDRGLPPTVRGHRPSAPSRRDRSRPTAGRRGEGDRRHRHAAGRGHRRHHPLLAHRRSRRGGAGRPPAARGHGSARTQERRPHRVPVVRAGRDRRHQGRRGGDARVRRPRDPAAGRGHGLRRQRPRRGP